MRTLTRTSRASLTSSKSERDCFKNMGNDVGSVKGLGPTPRRCAGCAHLMTSMRSSIEDRFVSSSLCGQCIYELQHDMEGIRQFEELRAELIKEYCP